MSREKWAEDLRVLPSRDAPTRRAPAPWKPVAAVLFAVAWGTNQFSPLLLIYRERLGLSAATLGAIFGLYVLGLLPGFVRAGTVSERTGRRALVAPFAALSLVASAVLALGSRGPLVLTIGRILTGVSAGVTFSAGSVWLQELSADERPDIGARRVTIALSAGFGAGPLVAGALAQWAPAPMVLPYLVHFVLLASVLVRLRSVPETVAPGCATGLPASVRPKVRERFARQVAPMAPWVFTFPCIAFVVFPGLLSHRASAFPIAYSGLLTSLTLLAGIVVQGAGRRLAPPGAARVGLGVGAAGILVGVCGVEIGAAWLLLVAAIMLGSAYGLCMTSGLRLLEAFCTPAERSRLVGAYYALTYLGFVSPFLLGACSNVAPFWVALVGMAGIAGLTSWLLPNGSSSELTR